MVLAQAPASRPAFEVASIRPFAPGGPGGGRGRGGGAAAFVGDRLELRIVFLADLLPYAFRVKEYQVSAPAWAQASMWTISAKLPDAESRDQAPEMMQTLLAERFKLVVHHEKRERQVYTLTLAENGPKLAIAPPGEYQVWDGSFPGFSFRGPLQTGAPITGRIAPGPNCSRRWEFIPLPMPALADALSRFLNRPVVDQTGLEGNYKITLEVSGETEAGMMTNMMAARGLPPPPPGGGGGGRKGGGGDGTGPPPNLISPGCPDPITMLQDGVGSPDAAIIKALRQLGLQLQQGKAPIDTIVVDHLEKAPTEN